MTSEAQRIADAIHDATFSKTTTRSLNSAAEFLRVLAEHGYTIVRITEPTEAEALAAELDVNPYDYDYEPENIKRALWGDR